jgi:hypothetical protein
MKQDSYDYLAYHALMNDKNIRRAKYATRHAVFDVDTLEYVDARDYLANARKVLATIKREESDEY